MITEKKGRIPHILLDTDFFEKPENLLLTDRFGNDGPIAILLVCARLMNEQDAKLKRIEVEALYRSANVEKAKFKDIIACLVEINWLREEGDFLTSDRVALEQARVLNKRRIYRENGASGGRPKSDFKPASKLLRTNSKAKSNQTKTKSTVTLSVTGPDISEIQITNEVIAERLKGFPNLNTQKIQEALFEWRDFRQDILKEPLSASMLGKLLKYYAEQPQNLIPDVDKCILEGWQGLHVAEKVRLEKIKANGYAKPQPANTPKPSTKPTAWKIEKIQRADGTWTERRNPIEGNQNQVITTPFKALPEEVKSQIENIKGI